MTNRRAFVLAGVLVALADSVFPPVTAAQTQPTGAWVIQSVTVGVPGAPNGESWDTAVGSVVGLLTRGVQRLKNIQPDVRICMESEHVPGTCMPVCQDADYSTEGMAYVCTQATDPRGLFLETKLHVLVREVDPGSARVIDDFFVDDPTKCEPCTTPTPGGTLWIRFQFAHVASYAGPFRAVSGTIPAPSTLPVATPSSGGGSTPPPPSPPAPAGAPSAQQINSALSDLRDADNCIGKDDFFPQGTVATRFNPLLQGADSDRLYQMAAFAMAVSDPTAKQLLLTNIRLRVGDDTFDGVMTLILGDVAQSQALLAAFQDVVKYFANKIVSKGLAQFLPSFQPATSLTPDVYRWILKKLTTDQLAKRAVDLMFTDHKISAECAFNELAKEGFIEATGAR